MSVKMRENRGCQLNTAGQDSAPDWLSKITTLLLLAKTMWQEFHEPISN